MALAAAMAELNPDVVVMSLHDVLQGDPPPATQTKMSPEVLTEQVPWPGPEAVPEH